MTDSQARDLDRELHLYEVQPQRDTRGFDLVSDEQADEFKSDEFFYAHPLG